jgi:hypothetical protein
MVSNSGRVSPLRDRRVERTVIDSAEAVTGADAVLPG